jgi:signal transduction histidine kinase
VLILLLGNNALAQASNPPSIEPVILTDGQGEYPLGLHLQILEDPDGKLTIHEVSSPAYDSQFIQSQYNVPNFGFTDSAYWVRFRIDNESRTVNEWLLELGFSNMQYVDLYSPSQDGEGYLVKQTGNSRPISTRDILSPNIVFKLAVPTQSQQTYYLRFQNGASMTLPLTLMTQEAFSVQSQHEQMFYWLFYGALLSLLVFHLLLLFTVREVSYLFFVILLTSLLLTLLSYSGFLETYLLPNISHLKQSYFPVFFSTLIASILLFSGAFLELKSRYRKLHTVNNVLLTGWGVLLVLSFFVNYHVSAVLMASWTIISLSASLIGGLFSWIKGFHPARFFMIAWFGMLVCFILLYFVRFGIAPSTPLSENLYLVGLVWMAVCWSIALADRINLLKAATERANRELSNSEHRLSQILDGLPLGVMLYGKDQKPRYANQRTVDIFNDPIQDKRVDTSLGRTLSDAAQYFSLKESGTKREYPMEKLPVLTALHGEPAIVDNIEIDRGDERVALEIQASPVRDEAGNVESAVVAIQDITQRKKGEAELSEYRKHLEKIVEERTAELSIINNELMIEASERKSIELALQQRIKWLSEVNAVHQTIAGMASLAPAYDDLSNKIIQLLDATLVFIFRWNGQGEEEINCYSVQDKPSDTIEILKAAFTTDSSLRKDIEMGRTIQWSSDQTVPLPVPFEQYLQENNYHAGIFTPMIIRQSVIGVFGLVWADQSKEIITKEADLIKRIALDLSDFAQDATLLDQNNALITAEERNHLARELHDSVTQTLFTASILAEATPRIWDKDQGIARQNMDKLSVLIRGALAEMRSMLIELRSEDLSKQRLDQLLNMVVEAARARTNAIITMSRMDRPELPNTIALGFYRIAREAINNAIVHAGATQIDIFLIAESGHVELHIKDDGCGFDPSAVTKGHLGISIMQERAAIIGAEIRILSEVGLGTEIVLSWLDKV